MEVVWAIIWMCSVASVLGHIPILTQPIPQESRIQWEEPPDTPIYVATGKTILTRAESLQRLMALRSVLAQNGISAYVIPTADAHNSQYIADSDARREWISGLSGSSGTAVVTANAALVWTDARYFTQFYMQVDTDHWGLMRQGTDLSISAWLVQTLTQGSVVGVDPTTYTRSSWNVLEATLTTANMSLVATPNNLVDQARINIGDQAPPRPNYPLITLDVRFTGRPSNEKISELMRQMAARGASALILTALDDIAYTLNLRGSDIPYNPVFFSYLVLRVDLASPSNIILFWGNGTLTAAVTEHLESEGTRLVARPYEDVFDYVTAMSNSLPAGSIIWLSDDGSHAIFSAAEGEGTSTLLSTLSPVALMKCVKNEVELAGFRSAHVKDGTAVVRFLRWIHEQVDAGVNVTEVQASDKLELLRAEEEDFVGPSFATIAGAGENGAVIHYKPSREGPQRVIKPTDMFLVDSGGQYFDGTTDITRTRHMSASPTEAQRRAFTRVLKGQISLATVVFPRGVVGHRLETLARKSLWDVGLDYGHGTGHGVGHFLNVHEGPSWILSGPSATDPGIVAGMIFSNGRPSNEKISELMRQMAARGASALILTALDDIAYTLNLRGSDIPYNPVFFSYLVLRVDLASPSNIILFWGNGTLTAAVTEHLESEGTRLVARPYEDVFDYVTAMSNSLPAGSIIWLSDDGSHAIFSAAEGEGTSTLLSTLSPVALMKCVKNEVELAGFRSAHVKDGTAVVRFLRWIHEQVDAGVNVTEVQASDKLELLRAEEEDFVGPSFATIAGAGENGAVIHYKPSREGPQRVIKPTDMFLVDSGGQYFDGTTDITRTRHMSASPTEAQRRAFTRVLKGQISLATVVFPRGVVGHRLETLARKSLWDVGLDYGHGTGHGVGHFLNVHEGPSWILSGPSATDPGIVAGMIFSNEPGYYEVDEYGIRHEDLVEVIPMTNDADHLLAKDLVSDFAGVGALGFYTISLAPHQAACIDVDLLTDFEISYINNYHARVLTTIGPILQRRNLTEDYEWLQRECAPVERSSTAPLVAAPILFLFTITSIGIF